VSLGPFINVYLDDELQSEIYVFIIHVSVGYSTLGITMDVLRPKTMAKVTHPRVHGMASAMGLGASRQLKNILSKNGTHHISQYVCRRSQTRYPLVSSAHALTARLQATLAWLVKPAVY
jgi:hypothetical protein